MTKPRRHRSRHLFTLLGTLVLGFLVLPVTTASARDGTDPTTPTNLRVTDRGATSLSISWSASRDRVGVAGYAIYANGGSTKLGKVTSAQLTGLTCGTSYTIRVDAFDAGGNRSGKAIVTQSTLACSTTASSRLYVSTTGSDTNSCSSYAPCLTFNRAYQVAQAGTVIEVSAGNYPAQQLLRHSAKTSSVDVVFQPAAGATVRVDRIHLGAWPGWSTTGPLGASHITFRDFKTNMVTAYGAQDFTWQNIDAKTFYMNAVDGGTVKGGDYGPCLSTEDPLTGCFGAQIDGGGNTNVVIDGARFHDFRNGNPSGGIVCLEVVSGTRVTVKNSQFQDCEHANILIEDWGSAPIAEVTIQANSLDMAWDGAGTQDDLSAVAVDVSGSASNVAVRNNLLCPPGTIDAPASDVTTSGNVASTSACSSGYTPPSGNPQPGGGTPPPGTTPPSDTAAPSKPSGLAVKSTAQTSITLQWNASTDNVGVTGYGLYRNGAGAGSATTLSATFSALTCGTQYTLGVDAYDKAGNRSAREALTASTSACPVPPSDTAAPSKPSGLAVKSTAQTSITLQWNASTDNVGVTGYGLYRNGAGAGSATTLSATFSALTCGTQYTLGVDAYDKAGNRSAREALTASTSACPVPPSDTAAPSKPSGLAVKSTAQTSITLQWNASTDNVGVTGYGLYRNGAGAGSATTLSATFSALTCGTQYTLGVDAYDKAGNRSAREALTASTSACPVPPSDTAAPSKPSGLAVKSTAQTSITLQWNASTDNVGVTGYGLYRNGASVGTATQTSATFSGLTCGTSYTLGVDAYDAAGNRSSKGALGVSTSACPVPGGGGGDLLVSMTGDDANPCTQAAPCRSFNRAYQAAQPGQVVVVAAGSYPQQNLYRHAAKTSLSDVVFQPAGGASVTVDSLHIGSYPHWEASALANPGASHVRLRGFRVTKLVSVANADDVTIENVTARSVYANGAHDLLVKGGSYGPCTAPSSSSVCTTSGLDNGWAGSARKNERITFDGVLFHDYRLAQPGSGEHWECMIVFQAHDLTVRNSRFTNCEQFNVLLDSFDPQNHHVTGTVRFENNFFDLPMHDVPGGWEPWHYSLFLDAPGGATYIVRNNRFCSDGRLVIGTHVPAANVTETGSVSDPAAC